MLITKSNPVGIDVSIQKFQSMLHSKLTDPDRWNNASTYRCYGRCYRNKKDKSHIAENYEGQKEYKEVYWDDSLSAISFFGISSPVTHEVTEKANVHLIFFVDLAKVKPSIAHRADEEVRKDVMELFGKGVYGMTYKSMDLWIENVLREYPGSIRDERLKNVDMHPVHCFRFNFLSQYDINKC